VFGVRYRSPQRPSPHLPELRPRLHLFRHRPDVLPVEGLDTPPDSLPRVPLEEPRSACRRPQRRFPQTMIPRTFPGGNQLVKVSAVDRWCASVRILPLADNVVRFQHRQDHGSAAERWPTSKRRGNRTSHRARERIRSAVPGALTGRIVEEPSYRPRSTPGPHPFGKELASKEQNELTGTIERLNARGFGFISAENREEYFFHHGSVDSPLHFDDLAEGDAVEFDLEDSSRGPRGCNVRRRLS
jgi:cold shock protein